MEVPKSEHLWMKFAGMYKNNPLFDEVVSNTEADGRELDTEIGTLDDTELVRSRHWRSCNAIYSNSHIREVH